MYDVGLSQRYCKQVVNVGWKALEARFIAKEAVDVDQ